MIFWLFKMTLLVTNIIDLSWRAAYDFQDIINCVSPAAVTD